ncbi:hypothetical protein EUGRSUZ_F00759 [Eucalyptus grandis]|uniref:Uncharacterized protein n=2 Tax=Eucalyptus grandis TaxID=71139 RepID=A0ACC3KCE9_EUCGR|nr:hypothetical protein EUGRSUZ_F00759 [Eucalyptus grandis]
MGTKTALAGPTPSATESGAGSASPLRSALAVRRPYALRAIVTDVRPGTPHRAIVAVYLIRGEPIWTVQRLFPSKARHFAWGPLHPRSIRVADRYRIASNGYIYPLSWTGSFSPISRVIACDLVISFSSAKEHPSVLFVGSRSSNPANYMVEGDFELPTAFDPFAEGKDSGAPGAKEYVHIRIQQRNGKKSLTTVQGLKKDYSYEKILKDLKKEFCCNGNVVQDKELGKIIQLQGDQRKNVSQFLVHNNIVKKDQIKIHGF